MKKSVVILLIVLVATFFCSASHGKDRYEYIGTSEDGEFYYYDTQSISYTNNPDVIRYWMKVVFSEVGRQKRIKQLKTQKMKDILRRVYEEKDCIEIDLVQNRYKLLQANLYSSNGQMVYTEKSSYEEWSYIAPESMLEIYRIVLGQRMSNRSTILRQPFVTPQPTPQRRIPQPREPQPQMPLNNQEQREEYGKLLEYISWLITQPDYPEFDRWVSQKMVQAGVIPTQVNAGIEEYIRLSGGKYSDIRAMLASWYREFYMEKYGKH